MSFTLESEPTMFDWPAKMKTRRVVSSFFPRVVNGIAKKHERREAIIKEMGYFCVIGLIFYA